MNIEWFSFILFSMAVFRLTRLVVYDRITSFLRAPFMMEYEEMNNEGEIEVYIIPKEHGWRGWIGELISCYWCTGIWAAAGLICLNIVYPHIAKPVIVILAIAGFAAIIETAVQAMTKE